MFNQFNQSELQSFQQVLHFCQNIPRNIFLMLEGQNALQRQCHLSGFQTKPDCCQKSESKYDFLSKFVNCPHCLTIRSYNRIMLWFTQLLCSNLFFQISRGPTAQIPLALLVNLSFQLGQLIGFWLCFTSEQPCHGIRKSPNHCTW